MKLAIGSDHGGYELKEEIKDLLAEQGIKYKDFGVDSTQSVDYPEYARPVAQAVAKDEYERGILICGTGLGMSMSANKIDGIRAALCHDVYSAKMARRHNNSNILTIGARVVGLDLAEEIVTAWLEEEFDGGRHQRRIDKISQLEE